jgi:hypothetical protein
MRGRSGINDQEAEDGETGGLLSGGAAERGAQGAHDLVGSSQGAEA